MSKVWGESNLLLGIIGIGIMDLVEKSYKVKSVKEWVWNNRLEYGCDPSQEYHESSLSPPTVLSFHY